MTKNLEEKTCKFHPTNMNPLDPFGDKRIVGYAPFGCHDCEGTNIMSMRCDDYRRKDEEMKHVRQINRI